MNMNSAVRAWIAQNASMSASSSAFDFEQLLGAHHDVAQLLPHAIDDVLDARDVQPFLAVEVVLERRRIHAGGGCDVARGGAIEALLAEQFQRGEDDAGAGFLATGITRVRTDGDV